MLKKILRKTKKFIFLLPIIWVGLIFGLAIIPNPNLDFSLKVIAHIVEYTILTFFLLVVLQPKISRVFVLAVLCAFLNEFCQIFAPTRGASLRDLGFDGVGILIGIGLWNIISHIIKIKKNN